MPYGRNFRMPRGVEVDKLGRREETARRLGGSGLHLLVPIRSLW